MNSAQKLLVFGGIALAVFGMLYGLHYALFVEHQTLDRMGGSLAHAFVSAADGQMSEAHVAIDSFGSTKYEYVRQVDAHSHWIGLAILLIVFGVVYESTGLGKRSGLVVAWALLAGSTVFPLGVLLQTLHHRSSVALALAVAGSALVTIALAVIAIGFVRGTA